MGNTIRAYDQSNISKWIYWKSLRSYHTPVARTCAVSFVSPRSMWHTRDATNSRKTTLGIKRLLFLACACVCFCRAAGLASSTPSVVVRRGCCVVAFVAKFAVFSETRYTRTHKRSHNAHKHEVWSHQMHRQHRIHTYIYSIIVNVFVESLKA